MKWISIALLILFVSIVIIACPGDDDDDNNDSSTPEIVPGEKMFGLYIDQAFSTCKDLYGSPDSSSLTNNLFYVMYFSPSFSLFVEDANQNSQLDDADPIFRISISNFTNWSGTTSGGNGIGSSLDAIRAEFGDCEVFEDDYCSYFSIGIEWAFLDNTENCDIVSVQRPL